ncbi:MAG: ABC transporter substrate-binding protein [Ilumatobacter fluminis]
MNTRTSRLLAGTVVAALLVAACGGGDDGDGSDAAPETTAAAPETTAAAPETTAAAPETTAAPPETTAAPPEATAAAPETTAAAPETTVPMADVGRVVVVAEEGVLADLLSLGVPVAASSATVPEAGFIGMDEFDTSGIEIFDYLTLSLEELAAYDADHIVTWEFIVNQVGAEQLAGVGAEVHVLPDGSTTREQAVLLGEFFGREAQAEELVAELDAEYAASQGEVPDGCEVSVAAIYAGANVAVFAEPIWTAPSAVTELGCQLVPSGDEVDTDRNGRLYLSLEQLGLLSAPTMILLQTEAVDGEAESVAEIEANPLWQTLPAVQADRVTVLDRIGYPGIAGEIRLIDDLIVAVQP